MSPNTIVLGGQEIIRPGFLPSPESIAEREKILAGRYFLVKIAGNAGVGEVWRCHGCGGKHQYMTLRCVERPFSGLEGALVAFYRHVGDSGAVQTLNPEQRVRYERMAELLGPVKRLPDLATRHPLLARSLRTDDRDLEMGSVALGVVEPIPPTLAQRYLDRINSQLQPRARLHLPGLRG